MAGQESAVTGNLISFDTLILITNNLHWNTDLFIINNQRLVTKVSFFKFSILLDI